MSSNKSKKLLKTIFKPNSSCGCGKPKLSDVFEPTPKPKISIHQDLDGPAADSSSSSSRRGRNDTVSTTDDTTIEVCSSSTSHHSFPSEGHDEDQPQKKQCSGLKKIPSNINDSCIAVVKDSDDPFEDFKQSMKQMILEKEIYAKKDLQELLGCFLELNSPSHRHIIVRAFTEIWNDVVAEKLLVSDQTTSLKKTGGGNGESCLDCCARAKAM